MKILILLFFLMSFPCALRAQASPCPPLAYKGAIDERYHITLKVDDAVALLDHEQEWSDGSFSGSYVYDKYNRPLKISATRISKNEISLNEETGAFLLKFVKDDLVGEWTSSSGKKMPVSLRPIPVPVEYESEIGLFRGFVNLVDGEFKSTIHIGNSEVKLYSWSISECMDNDLRGPSFSRKIVNNQNLYLVEWNIEYKPYGVLPTNQSVLIHPGGDKLDLSPGSSGTRFGIHEYESKKCSANFKETYIERVCLEEIMKPMNDNEKHKLEQHRKTKIYAVTDHGFVEGLEQSAFRSIKGSPEELWDRLENLSWQSLERQ